ncbi:50S ribosomal protein L21 [Candidatus Kaiserbacteria bacterium RIFCSPHIGHO2_02_FULL_49_34]|uniref:Large ribosomal subunit protein bL21 n=1 Tax=Candidatus Kaiserbacteria bacterium RIFCSPHIGHO2_02_FULL_49_34 TaxID=1798491 RepID=A0A1F6DIU5_9BACT|nr:MAG: 50S ribosomal protein L21 [Candidatus Kaiserbacteria bacterium RIFCSPHIGHO2_02_FULL_49_34]
MEKEVQSQAVPFAVIETGGKQYKVAVGDVLDVELLGGELNEGDDVSFDKVLLTETNGDTKIGTPYLAGVKVSAKYVGLAAGPKITIVRYQQKSNRDRKQGHRQKYSRVEITAI